MTEFSRAEINAIIDDMPEHSRSAARFAAERHAGQFRGDGITPYIIHPLEVAASIHENFPDRMSAVAAAMLHDVLEDTQTTYDELVLCFGRKVADLVKEVSDDPGKSAAERKLQQRLRVPTYSDDALIIKFADKTVNLIDLRECPPNWAPWKVDQCEAQLLMFLELAVPEMVSRNLMPVMAIDDDEEKENE